MTTASLPEQIADVSHQRDRQRAERWLSLVAAVANDEGDAEGHAVELDDLGRAAEDLTRAVETHRQRALARERLAALPARRQRARAAGEEMRRADRLLLEARERHHQTVAPLAVELAEAERHLGDEGRLLSLLLTTCPDPDLVQAMRSATASAEQVARRVTDLADSCRQLQDAVADGERALAAADETWGPSKAEAATREQVLARYRRRLAQAEQEQAMAVAEAERLGVRAAELVEQARAV